MNPMRKEIAPNPNPKAAGTDKIEKYGWKTLDRPGIPFLAEKSELHIDLTYQRTMISQSRVLQIAQAWSHVACGSLIVAQRTDGRMFVIDGQHRLEAANRRSDIKELPCLVFKCERLEEEAMAFYRANCVRGAVSSYDKLRGLLAGGDALARDSVELMLTQGYKPSKSESEWTIRCIAMFLSFMKTDRGVLIKTWPLVAELHGGRCISELVFGAVIYLSKYGSDDITSREWRAKILKPGFAQIYDSINRARLLYSRGGSKVWAIGALDIINKGTRKKLILVDPQSKEETQGQEE